MAKCKLCKIDIPDGTDYCPDCQNKRNDEKAKESYLDSLLNSVKNTSGPSNITYRKKNREDISSNPIENVKKASENKMTSNEPETRKPVNNTDSGSKDDDLYRVDFSDLEDFTQFNFEADIQDIDHEIEISDEDLFGDEISGFLQDVDNDVEAYDYKAELKSIVGDTISHHTMNNTQYNDQIGPDGQTVAENETISAKTEPEPDIELRAESEHINETVASNDEDMENLAVLEDETAKAPEESNDTTDNSIHQETEELPEDTGLDLDLDELLNSLNLSDTVTAKEEPNDIHTEPSMVQLEDIDESSLEDMFHSFSNEDEIEDLKPAGATPNIEPVEGEDEDFMKLLSQISGDDPVSDDLKAISEMMVGPKGEDKNKNMPGDVGEVFSDALTAVSSLKDFEHDEDLSVSVIEQEEEAIKGRKKKKAKKKTEKSEKKDKKPKSEKSLFQRLFGNVKDEKTAAKFAEELKKKETEEISGKTDKSKSKKKKKGDKAAEAPDMEETPGNARRPGRTAEEEDPIDKKAARKKAKEEKKRAKATIEIIDEIEEDPGRINRLGATIVFIFFGVLAAILILGTNIISYTLNIQHASAYFSKQKYTEAYYEVYGVELRDEDLELYEKIATVMFVNKQLNSYNNYYNIKQYPQALDSLLKGLKRYDKYIELATYLGVDSDLNYVRKQILAELDKKFNLTEAEAEQINRITNMKDYSLAVYDVVLEKMNK